jgi:hypothetical protein
MATHPPPSFIHKRQDMYQKTTTKRRALLVTWYQTYKTSPLADFHSIFAFEKD